ncbi:MBL fold metallo-hydrolase [Actinomadura verrucosospora]|uniref:Beta-lactamase domain protein n=1 Tax=Actinomadura verrucosospora TaxID=46165 RepID=A0A7D3VV97_ACTVE|nr:MBL fold metallo-hydrolase [Actinomadura verrucosospora]QKG21934.1 beta-lactamase domain protein [Actinomadura verrucosospora]
MEKISDGVFLLDGRPRYAYNAYLVADENGEVLVDAGSRHARRRILRQLDGRAVRSHLVTHAHPDHQGASHAVCTRFGVPLMSGARDADAIESGELVIPDHPVARWQLRHWAGPGHPVAHRLAEADEVAGFTVLETPGHTPGSIALWRERDRVLIVGDVLNRRPAALGGGIAEAPPAFCTDPGGNRRSIRRLAGLRPAVVCFGHGRPLRDPARLADFADVLPG